MYNIGYKIKEIHNYNDCLYLPPKLVFFCKQNVYNMCCCSFYNIMQKQTKLYFNGNTLLVKLCLNMKAHCGLNFLWWLGLYDPLLKITSDMITPRRHQIKPKEANKYNVMITCHHAISWSYFNLHLEQHLHATTGHNLQLKSTTY